MSQIGFIEVAAIVGGVVAIVSLGVSIGVYKTKIPVMQKEIDELKQDVRKDRDRNNQRFEKQGEAIGEVEKAIVGIETNIEALLASSSSNGQKLDSIFRVLAERNAAH